MSKKGNKKPESLQKELKKELKKEAEEYAIKHPKTFSEMLKKRAFERKQKHLKRLEDGKTEAKSPGGKADRKGQGEAD